jgi:hypothetical protein
VREAHAQALAVWKKLEERRKEHNMEIRRAYQEGMKEWEVEHDVAKSENRQAGWTKPKQGKLEKAIPWPKKPEIEESDEEEEPEEEEEVED